MKVKLPGLGGLQMFFLAHGEKMIIAVVAVCVMYMIVRSLGRERLPDERQAAVLQREISAASSEISQSTWEGAVKDFPDQVRLARPLEQTGNTTVDPRQYETKARQFGWDPAVVPPMVRRSDPVLLAAVDLEATGSSGLLAFINDRIRDQRRLEQSRREAQAAADQAKRQQEAQEENERRRGARGRNADGRDEPIDPEHPNRRPVSSGLAGTLGVPLAGDEEVKVAYWACVVAKVPIKEQFKLYEDALAHSQGYNMQNDTPRYLGYFVERTEVRPGAKEDWKPLGVYSPKGIRVGSVVTAKALYGSESQSNSSAPPSTVQSVVTDWAGSNPEVVDPRFLDPSGLLASPLPPLVGRNFGRDATHRDIPLAIDAVQLEAETSEADATPADAEGPGEDVDEFSSAGAGFGGGRGIDSGGGRGSWTPGGGIDAGGGFSRGGGRGMGGIDSMDRGRSIDGGYAGGRGSMGAEGLPQTPNWLLRFFDYSVQPGKKYKYRVRLVLSDPNAYVSQDWLDSEALARVRAAKEARGSKTPVRMTEWSEPSRTVSIPLAGTVHVASARPPVEQSFTDEPRASLLVESFSADAQGKAVQGSMVDDFRRGYVANQTGEAEMLVNDNGQLFVDKDKAFNFRTGVTIADIRGGERLPGRDNQRPARVLFMDPAGQMFVHTELDDKEAVEMHKAIFEEDEDGTMGGRGGRGFGRGGGEERMMMPPMQRR